MAIMSVHVLLALVCISAQAEGLGAHRIEKILFGDVPNVAMGHSVGPDGTDWIWAYDVASDAFRVLRKSDAEVEIIVTPGGSQRLAAWGELNSAAGTMQNYAILGNANGDINGVGTPQPYLVSRRSEAGRLVKEGFFSASIISVFPSRLLMLFEVVESSCWGLGTWKPFGGSVESYLLLSASSGGTVGTLEKTGTVTGLGGQVSPLFGPESRYFLMQETKLNALITRQLTLFDTAPLSRVAEAPLPGSMLAFGCSDSGEEVLFAYTEGGKVRISGASVCSSGKEGEEAGLQISSIGVLPDEMEHVSDIALRSGSVYWSTGKTDDVVFAREWDVLLTGSSQVYVVENAKRFDLNNDATIMITYGDGSRFDVWSLGPPGAVSMASRRIVQGAISVEAELVPAQTCNK